MRSPERSIEEIQADVEAARGTLNGAAAGLDEAERALENLTREVDERRGVKERAVRALDDARELLRLRSGIPHEVATMRKEFAAIYDAVAAVEEGEDDGVLGPAERQRADFLAREIRSLCPHPYVIACANDARTGVQERECVICLMRETALWTTASPRMQLRDMSGREIILMSGQHFSDIGAEFADLPDCPAITAKFEALVFHMRLAAATPLV